MSFNCSVKSSSAEEPERNLPADGFSTTRVRTAPLDSPHTFLYGVSEGTKVSAGVSDESNE